MLQLKGQKNKTKNDGQSFFKQKISFKVKSFKKCIKTSVSFVTNNSLMCNGLSSAIFRYERKSKKICF